MYRFYRIRPKRTVMRIVFLTLVSVFLLWGCGDPLSDEDLSYTPFLQEEVPAVDSILATLSLEEKVGQLLMLKASAPDSIQQRQIIDLAGEGKVSGLFLEELSFSDFLTLVDSSRKASALPPFIGFSQQVALHNQFSDLTDVPAATTVRALASEEWRREWTEAFRRQISALGTNLWLGSAGGEQEGKEELFKLFREMGVLVAGNDLTPEEPGKTASPDTALLPPARLARYRHLVKEGVSGVGVDSFFIDRHLPRPMPVRYWRDFLKTRLNFDGLVLAAPADREDIARALQAGADLLVLKGDLAEVHQQAVSWFRRHEAEAKLDARVRKVLLAKYWMRSGLKSRIDPPAPEIKTLQASVSGGLNRPSVSEAMDREAVMRHFYSPAWRSLSYRTYERALTVASNPHELLPLQDLHKRRFRLLEYSTIPYREFREYFSRYADFDQQPFRPDDRGRISAPGSYLKEKEVGILLLDEYLLHGRRDSSFIQEVQRLGKEGRLLLVNFREPANLTYFDSTLTVIQLYERNDLNEQLAAQLLFGAVAAQGHLPAEINRFFSAGKGILTPQVRLQYAPPEMVGILPEKLVGIDAVAHSAVDEKAAPGCQVLIAKNGKIIYSKAFGSHSYDDDSMPVEKADLYDLASVTKVAATTLVAMQLYDQGVFGINDRLKEHLSCDRQSTIRNIPLKKLFTHQSGLQPHMPVIPYLLYRDRPNAECDHFFCKNGEAPYNIQVADHFYFDEHYLDTIWQEVHRLEVGSQRRYRYSDVNFILIQRMLEEKTGKTLDELTRELFYQPLGLRRSTFNPAQRFDLTEIVPTQNDQRWRQQLVHGYVHDETAALMGGVGGNAGLFSNAEELAVLFQMLLNGGHYGGRQYLSPETIELFTSPIHGNHRGLGFDKPYRTNESAVAAAASPQTYGHTGFTGTCVWVDPREELIFIFLSNRVHPSSRNRTLFRDKVRRRIHQVVYDAIDSYYNQIPELQPTAGS